MCPALWLQIYRLVNDIGAGTISIKKVEAHATIKATAGSVVATRHRICNGLVDALARKLSGFTSATTRLPGSERFDSRAATNGSGIPS